jgi:hypothetical protein
MNDRGLPVSAPSTSALFRFRSCGQATWQALPIVHGVLLTSNMTSITCLLGRQGTNMDAEYQAAVLKVLREGGGLSYGNDPKTRVS